MSPTLVFASSTGSARGAIWTGTEPTITNLRPADLLFLSPGEGLNELAVLRALVGGDAVRVTMMEQRIAAAAWRMQAGREPWPKGPPTGRLHAYTHEVFEGRRLHVVDCMTLDEVRRVTELEALADRSLAELVAGYRARSERPFRKGDRELVRIAGIERAIDHVWRDAFIRKHGGGGTIFERLERLHRSDSAAAEHFAVLGIPATTDVTAIRSAWKKRALATHPDRGGDAAAFRAARAAYDAAIRAAGAP